MVYVKSCTLCVFFFKQKTAYEMRISDWSADVCSSDLIRIQATERAPRLLDVERQALRLVQQSPAVVERRTQFLQRAEVQAGQVALLVGQHLRLVLQLPHLVVDLLERARGGQQVLLEVGRIEHGHLCPRGARAQLGRASGRDRVGQDG